MIVPQSFKAQNIKILLITTNTLKTNTLIIITGRIIHSHIERRSVTYPYPADTRQLLQLVYQRISHIFIRHLFTVYIQNIHRVISQRSFDQVFYLQKHRNGGSNQANSDRILKNNKELTEYHLRLFTESPPHHFDRLRIRDDDRRQQSGYKSDQNDQNDNDHAIQRSDHINQIYLLLQQIARKRRKEKGQQQTGKERNRCQQRRFHDQTGKQFFTRRPQQSPGSHFLCPETGLRHSQIYIINNGKQKNKQTNR